MKKLKSIFGVLVLSACMVGNSFAGDTGGTGISGFFDSLVNAVVSFATSADDCEGRICTDCKPGSDGGGGTCRPTE